MRGRPGSRLVLAGRAFAARAKRIVPDVDGDDTGRPAATVAVNRAWRI
jgi:hypothetical protein